MEEEKKTAASRNPASDEKRVLKMDGEEWEAAMTEGREEPKKGERPEHRGKCQRKRGVRPHSIEEGGKSQDLGQL